MASQGKKVTDPRRRFGNHGEDLAVVFFLSRGFTAVARNWSCRFGEIDLVCRKGSMYHFIEVKTRRSSAFGHPEEAVTAAKRRKLQAAAELYLRAAGSSWAAAQIDVLAITILPGQLPQYHYVENISV